MHVALRILAVSSTATAYTMPRLGAKPASAAAGLSRSASPSMLIPFIDSGKPGLNVRPYDKLLNFAAPYVVPLLVQKGSVVFKPLYKVADKLRNRKALSEFRSECSNSYKPIVVFSSRTVKDVEAYKKEFSKFAAETQSSGAGVRAIFSFMDREKENTALQLAWYDGPADFVAPPAKLTSCYSGTDETDYTQIWGSWDDTMKSAMSAEKGCKCSFVRDVRGFLKDPSAANEKGFATGEPPMIWISRRDILPGRMQACGESFQCGTDRMYTAAPAALGICEYTDSDEENTSWSLRVFNDYDTGFKAHFPVPSPILFRMVFNVIPEWVPGPFPLGFSFSSQEYIDSAVASNGGNAAYKPYIFESDALIGPKPDFGKGF